MWLCVPFLACCGPSPAPVSPSAPPPFTIAQLSAPAPLSTWPWPQAAPELLRKGVTHWQAQSQKGEVLDLLAFDFASNPRLELEIYDQDEDDARPFDDQAEIWTKGVGQVIRHLNSLSRGRVIAASNGLFFSHEKRARSVIGNHVAPVVLRGRVLYNVGNHRWSFGVHYAHGNPSFRTLLLPDRSTLAREYDFSACGAQCLIREGKPLRLSPFPIPNAPPAPRSSTTLPDEAGAIPLVDHMKTSRVSLAWSKDSRKLYLLVVTEPDNETESALKLKHWEMDRGGWRLADLQRFWQSMGVWGAINSDGGDVAQLTFLRPDGKYILLPPRWAYGNTRLTFAPDFKNAPAGGSLMYFYVIERPGHK